MKANVPDLLEKGRVRRRGLESEPGEWGGAFVVRGPAGAYLTLVASDGTGWPLPPPAWEHVSVSLYDRCPTWYEMAWVKDLCWDPDECVVQFHPPKSSYVNCHEFCLHLWKPVGVAVPLPPPEAVGPRPAA